MPESPQTVNKPAPRNAPVERVSGRVGEAIPPIRIRYYHRMRRNKVYPVTVSWHQKSRKRPESENSGVVVRLIAAGAQVVPTEHTLDSEKPKTFYVTPLASGWLRGVRLEVVQEGQKVHELLKLWCKVTSQRVTLLLLLLTFLVPWVILTYFHYTPDAGSVVEYNRRLGKFEESRGQVPGKQLETRIRANAPETPSFLREYVPVVGPWLNDYLDAFPEDAGSWYTAICKLCRDEPIAYYAFWGLLAFTVISWWWHLEGRKRRVTRQQARAQPA